MNKAESRRIAGYLESAGCRTARSFSDADVIVLNTCVVRQSAENRVVGTLGLLKGLKAERPDVRLVLTGCFVDSDHEAIIRRFPQVDLAFGPGDYAALEDWGRDRGILASDQTGTTRDHAPCAYIPIVQGCNNHCSYCIVPYRRGREVSRPLAEILCEAGELVRHGVREITLLGQNVDSYGHDLPGRPDLADLLAELNGIGGLFRIRFLTSYPALITSKLIDTVASADRVCEHLQLPVQAGDNDLLSAMGRGYTVEQYRTLVDTIRNRIPGVSLGTDVIVGFPGETEERFGRTFSLLEETRFDVVHIAAYSPRPGTPAARAFDDDVPGEAKKRRLADIESLQAGIAGGINAQLQGHMVEVLVEGRKKGRWYGRTRSDKLVFFDDAGDWLGRLVPVHIEETSPWSLRGHAITHS